MIDRALAGAAAGRGHTVLLTAPSGRGLSHQLAAAADLARRRGLQIATAAGRRAERELRFSVAVELLEPAWRAASAPARPALMEGPAAAAIELLDGAGDQRADADGGFAVIRGLWLLARRLAAQSGRGLAIIVDDLHDVDAASADLLAFAAHRQANSAVTIIAGHRGDLSPRAPLALAAISEVADTVALQPLGASAAAALVSALAPGAPARFTSECVAAAAGNPALLQALVSGGAARGAVGSPADAGRLRATVGDELTSLMTRRLSRVPAPARALLLAVASAEGPIDIERAGRDAGLTPEVALAAFDRLIAGDLLLAEDPLAFTAPVLRTAVRAILTAGEHAVRSVPARDAPRDAAASLDQLTRGEQQVAKLAARGMTTKQIAATLFVTPKTVEFHLRNVYRKLEVPSSRAELTRLLGPIDQPAPSMEAR